MEKECERRDKRERKFKLSHHNFQNDEQKTSNNKQKKLSTYDDLILYNADLDKSAFFFVMHVSKTISFLHIYNVQGIRV